jgi:hypothetical protein
MESGRRTVALPKRFSRHNILHFLCGTVAEQRLAVEMEHERTYQHARTSGKTTARLKAFFSLSKQVHASWISTSSF